MYAATMKATPWHLLPLVVVALAVPGCGDGTQEYVSEAGRFRVRMPGAPSESKEGELPRGIRKVSLEQRWGAYSVSWEDLPSGDKEPGEDLLDRVCDSALEALKARALVRKEITLPGGHPGRELVAAWGRDQNLVHDRVYLVGRRKYHVMASGERWWVESAEARKFLNSFEARGE